MKYGIQSKAAFDKGEWAVFSITKAPFGCCGLFSIQNIGCGLYGLDNLSRLLKHHITKFDRDNNKEIFHGWLVTLVNFRYIELFKTLGFVELKTFINPNTSNTIHILFRQGPNA